MKLLIFLHLTLASLFFCACSGSKKADDETLPRSIDTVPMLVMQIQKCSRLYTAEYDIHKIVTHDDEKRLKGTVIGHDFDIRLPLGDRKIAIPIDAKLKAYIDFSTFSEKNVSRNGRKIVVTLPDPKVTLTSSKVDQKNVKEYVAMTRSHFSDAEMTAYEQQGREAIIASIPRLGIIETARENAASVLIPMIEMMGYEESDITVTFRKDFTERDLGTIMEQNASGR